MATYNPNITYLKQSLESIYNQTYNNFEIILVDDGSDDDLQSFIQSFFDKRIRYVKLKEHVGITKALNKGLKFCRGEYIARMDDDDISLPNRFEKQIQYMEEHMNVNVLGCNKQNFGINNNISNIEINQLSREEQQIELFFSNIGVPHPTVMLRKEFMDRNKIQYNEDYIKSQDYDLWVTCVQFTPIYCLPDVLLKYRCHQAQISVKKRGEQKFYKDLVRINQVEMLGIRPSNMEKEIHIDFCEGKIKKEEYRQLIKWLRKLNKYNRKSKYFDEAIFAYRLFVKAYSGFKDLNPFIKLLNSCLLFKLSFFRIYFIHKYNGRKK